MKAWGTGANLDANRFDSLTKILSVSASRRLAVRGLVAVLAATFSGIAPSSILATELIAWGGGNRAVIGGGGRTRRRQQDHHEKRRERHDHDHHEKRHDRECRPKSRRKLCQGRCDQIVGDGCGGKIDCACEG